MNHVLPKALRGQLENTVKAARNVAEKAANAALAQLAMADTKGPDYRGKPLKAFRRQLRADGRV